MPLNFPDSPNNGDEYTSGNRTWVFNGPKNAWEQKPLNHAGSHAAGGSDPLTPAAIGALTRADSIKEELFNVTDYFFCTTAGGGNSGAGSSVSRSGSAATGWGRMYLATNVTRTNSSGAYTFPSSTPIAVAFVGYLDASNVNLNGSVSRLIVGDARDSSTPAYGNANALSTDGFGAEVYWSSVNNRSEVRLFAYGAGGYVVSSGIEYVGRYNYEMAMAVSSDGAGNIKLFMSDGVVAGILQNRMEHVLSLSGGPTTGAIRNGISLVSVNHGVNAPVGFDALHGIVRAKIVLGQIF